MAPRTSNNLKEELAKKAETTAGENKLKKSMSIADLIKAMLPEIKRRSRRWSHLRDLQGWLSQH